MKKIIIMIALVLFAFKAEAKNNSYIDFDIFYTELSPYGEWITVGAATAWRPFRIEVGWNPYTIGRWVWTDYGWYWDSYEPFGWATYHYGRWMYDDYYGWVWMPDYTWGPSWVEWRYNDYYIGWAPLPPIATFRVSVGIHFGSRWHSPYHHWHFVSYNYFCHSNVHYYMEAPVYNQKIFSQTKYRTNYYSQGDRIVNGGVDRQLVEKRSNQKIERRDLVVTRDNKTYSSKSRDNQREVVAYRPDIKDVSKTSSRIIDESRTIDDKRIKNNSESNSRNLSIESRDSQRDKNVIQPNNRKVESQSRIDSKTSESRNSNLFDQLKRSKAEAERTKTNRSSSSGSRVINNEKGSTNTRIFNSVPESKKSNSSSNRSYTPQSRSNSSEASKSNSRSFSSQSSTNNSKTYTNKSRTESKPAVKSTSKTSNSKNLGNRSSSSSSSKSTQSRSSKSSSGNRKR